MSMAPGRPARIPTPASIFKAVLHRTGRQLWDSRLDPLDSTPYGYSRLVKRCLNPSPALGEGSRNVYRSYLDLDLFGVTVVLMAVDN